MAAHPGLSGILPLADGRDAFAARSLLADDAEHSLDVQYYIWHADMSGMLLFDALRRAADRGVRVRLLLDDNNTNRRLDTLLAALDTHPRIEVRLFNPYKTRRWRLLGLLTDFSRLNRRMHNKSFTADNHVTIVGGRNIGDEYFDAAEALAFADLDIMAVGAVVRDVSADFERYWNSAAAFDATRVLPSATPASLALLDEAVAGVRANPAAIAYTRALAESPSARKLLRCDVPFEWAKTEMVSDDPAKALGRARKRDMLWPRLRELLGVPEKEWQLVSPYFVPGKAGGAFLTGLAKAGVKITVLTNSLEATDVPAVHSGYAKWRKPLLRAGASLFEMKKTFSSPSLKGYAGSGSSNSSLHAKTISVDRLRVFVGSFNFDPRSARLNTENGFVIESPRLAQAIADAFTGDVPDRAYRVVKGRAGLLRWIEQVKGKEIVHDKEPGLSLYRRILVWVLSKLPIEWLL